MRRESGLRERKKAETRRGIADAAARLFATQGFDDVLVLDVARAANVSEQTVYNYFPTKQDLVFDRADDVEQRLSEAVRDREEGVSPAQALRPVVAAEIDDFRRVDLDVARGEFPAQCLASPALRRGALELREKQVEAITVAILETDPALAWISARVHAAGLVAVAQVVTDAIGTFVSTADTGAAVKTRRTAATRAAVRMLRDATTALEDLDHAYRALVENTSRGRA